jgi:hypothetical protein
VPEEPRARQAQQAQQNPNPQTPTHSFELVDDYLTKKFR